MSRHKDRGDPAGWFNKPFQFETEAMDLEERVVENQVRRVKYHKPQTTLPQARVIKKINKWTVEAYRNHKTGKISYAVSDGLRVYYPIIYDSGVVAYDDPSFISDIYPIPKVVKNWFEAFAYRVWRARRESR